MDTVENTLGTETIKNGKFEFRGIIEHPRSAAIRLKDQKGNYLPFSDSFIVEVDSVNLEYVKQGTPTKFSGGTYNKSIFNAVNQSDDYLDKLKAYNKFSASIANEDLEKDTLKLQSYLKVIREMGDSQKNEFRQIFNTAKDPYEKLFAMGSSNFMDMETRVKVLDSLYKVFGTVVPAELVIQRTMVQKTLKRNENQATMAIGATIKDFTAKNLAGKDLRLAEILKNNKYVLVEFWASWCGPCRGEVPHMKKAYKRYKNKGFEIFAFSLDGKKDRWEKAMNEDAVPWLNVSDLLANDSPIVKMFGIAGIPKNYLIDKNGVIVAIDLRQDKLDKKLEELLGK